MDRRRGRRSGLHLCSSSLVVVDDLDVFRSGRGPAEADPPWLVDPDAVLHGPVAVQLLQPVNTQRYGLCQLRRRDVVGPGSSARAPHQNCL
jgi:hypothetical protein